MGNLTDRINLYTTDTETDGNDYFDFERDLDNNWRKIDDNLLCVKYSIDKIFSKGEWVWGIVDNVKTIFESLVDFNQNNPLSDNTKWKKVSLGGSGKDLLEIYLDPFIDETENKGRILNGQIIIQEQFKSAVAKLKRKIGNIVDVFNESSVKKYGNVIVSDNGIASGFSETSWVTIDKAFNPLSSSFEIVVDFTTGDDITTTQTIFSNFDYAWDTLEFSIIASKIHLRSYKNNTGTSIFDITVNTVLKANTRYVVKIAYDSDGYKIYLGNDIDSLVLEAQSSVTTSILSCILAFGANFDGNYQYYGLKFLGTINLFNSYVKINNEYFWNPRKKIASLMPDIICGEDEWQALKTMSVLGQVAKFVIDDEMGTVRLPAIKNIQGVYSLANAGLMVGQSLPNLKWKINSNSTASDFSFFGEWHGAVTTSGGIKAEATTTNKALAESNASGAQRLYSLSYNANSADSTYQDNAPVQEEACCYPYCICLNPEVEEAEKPINDYLVNNPNTLLESKYSPLVLDNLSYLRSEGQRNSGNVYVAVWNKLIEAYNSNSMIGKAEVKLITDTTATDYDFKIDLETTEFILPLLDGSEDFLSDKRDILEVKESYTAPCNGWYFANAIGTANVGNIYLQNATAGYATQNNTHTQAGNVYIFARRNDKMYFSYSNVTNPQMRFIHAKGNGHLYYYVGDTLQNPDIINIARIEEQLIDFQEYFTVNHKVKTLMSKYSISANTAEFGTKYSFDLSDYLPDDGNDYLVQFSIETNSTTSQTAVVINYASSDLTPNPKPPLIVSKGRGIVGASAHIVIGKGRTLNFHIVCETAGEVWAHLFGYQKIKAR